MKVKHSLCLLTGTKSLETMCELSSWILFSIRSELLQMIRVDEMLFVLPAVFAFYLLLIMCFSLSVAQLGMKYRQKWAALLKMSHTDGNDMVS